MSLLELVNMGGSVRCVSEADLQRAVLELAKLRSWRVAHFRPAQVRQGRYATPVGADGAGFPDLVLVRGERLLFVELKAKGGYVKPLQREWHEALALAGHPVQVWKPRHWASGEIDAALA